MLIKPGFNQNSSGITKWTTHCKFKPQNWFGQKQPNAHKNRLAYNWFLKTKNLPPNLFIWTLSQIFLPLPFLPFIGIGRGLKFWKGGAGFTHVILAFTINFSPRSNRLFHRCTFTLGRFQHPGLGFPLKLTLSPQFWGGKFNLGPLGPPCGNSHGTGHLATWEFHFGNGVGKWVSGLTFGNPLETPGEKPTLEALVTGLGSVPRNWFPRKKLAPGGAFWTPWGPFPWETVARGDSSGVLGLPSPWAVAAPKALAFELPHWVGAHRRGGLTPGDPPLGGGPAAAFCPVSTPPL